MQTKKEFIDEIAFALQTHFSELDSKYFLDKQTMEVLLNYPEIPIFKEDKKQNITHAYSLPDWLDVNELLTYDPERFIGIRPTSTHDDFEMMELFVEQQTNKNIQESLIEALERKHPFRNFKDIVDNNGDLREEWFAFKNKAMEQKALQWLEDNDIGLDKIAFSA